MTAETKGRISQARGVVKETNIVVNSNVAKLRDTFSKFATNESINTTAAGPPKSHSSKIKSRNGVGGGSSSNSSVESKPTNAKSSLDNVRKPKVEMRTLNVSKESLLQSKTKDTKSDISNDTETDFQDLETKSIKSLTTVVPSHEDVRSSGPDESKAQLRNAEPEYKDSKSQSGTGGNLTNNDKGADKYRDLERENSEYKARIEELEARVMKMDQVLDGKDDRIKELNNALNTMNDKIVAQVNKTADIEHAKEKLELEVEDLSRTLFEEANGMVAQEKRARAEAEKEITRLRNVINDLKLETDMEKRQSQELKGLLEKLTEEYDEQLDKLRQENSQSHMYSGQNHGVNGFDSSSDDNVAAAGGLSEGALVEKQFQTINHLSAISSLGIRNSHSASSSPRHSGIRLSVDDIILSEFDEFLRTGPQTKANKITSIPFMKRLITDDVEPCLRFGLNPRISSRNIIDAIAANTLQIEEMTPTIQKAMKESNIVATSNGYGGVSTGSKAMSSKQAMFWERFSGTVQPNPSGCQACGREGTCTHRFRMGTREGEQWVQIDVYCRDRLVSVCEFFGFVNLVRRGHLANHNILEMYQETVRLRLCMYYARVGIYSSLAAVDPSLVSGTALSGSGRLHMGGLTSPANNGTPRTSIHSDRSLTMPTPVIGSGSMLNITYGDSRSPPPAQSQQPQRPTTPTMLAKRASSPLSQGQHQKNIYPSPRAHLVPNGPISPSSSRMRSMSASVSNPSKLNSSSTIEIAKDSTPHESSIRSSNGSEKETSSSLDQAQTTFSSTGATDALDSILKSQQTPKNPQPSTVTITTTYTGKDRRATIPMDDVTT